MSTTETSELTNLQTLRRHVREGLSRRIYDGEDLIEAAACMVYVAFAHGVDHRRQPTDKETSQ